MRSLVRRTAAAPPQVFTWDTYLASIGDDVVFGASGATTNRRRAVRALGDALRDGPAGASGVVFKVELDPFGVCYRYGGIVARAVHDPTSGCVTWSNARTAAGLTAGDQS